MEGVDVLTIDRDGPGARCPKVHAQVQALIATALSCCGLNMTAHDRR